MIVPVAVLYDVTELEAVNVVIGEVVGKGASDAPVARALLVAELEPLHERELEVVGVRTLVRVLDDDDVVVIVTCDVNVTVITLDKLGDEVTLPVVWEETVDDAVRVEIAEDEAESLALLLALGVVDGIVDVVARCDEPNVWVAGADSDDVDEEVTEMVEVEESVDASVGSFERVEEILDELDDVPVFTADVERIAVEEIDCKVEKVSVGESVFEVEMEEIDVNDVLEEEERVL